MIWWWPFLLLVVCPYGMSQECMQEPAQAYRFTGATCRITYPAAVVLNEKTTKVIEAAFQHTKYPAIKGEKTLLFWSKLVYSLDNLEIYNLTIGQSAFELRPGEGISLNISNVSVVFRGNIHYACDGCLVNFGQSVDFEIESQIDLGINPKLYCGKGKVAADTTDCHLKFHKLNLLLHGDREPNWLKKLFTNFLTFTIKVAVRSQICQEINKVANILADFIQETAENFLTDGDISVDVGVTGTPVITANYIESYHKGFTKYKNTTTVIEESNFNPRQLTENRMLYFWLSDQLFIPILKASHQDGRFQLNISGPELRELFKTNPPDAMPEYIRECIMESSSSELRVWSSSNVFLNTSRDFGTTAWADASGQLYCGGSTTPLLSFGTNVAIEVGPSYANKKLSLHGKVTDEEFEKIHTFLENAVKTLGVPTVITVLETEITRLLDKQGVNLFDIYNPEVIPQDGYVVIQMDFGFPHHLLVEFLRKTLE
ncbi:cholesteryl ester transfer protein [Eucyclogobius newberryi]|uniref:cholesteryl ester transfer protein n=1 Tax=Eucyclogobius newberryi TaxID=166745 RepID=UPI003B5CEBF7